MENANGETVLDNTKGPKPFIAKTYAYHKPSEAGLGMIQKLRIAFSDMQRLIELTCPNSRERSKALTELEDSAMWAIKAVVCNDPLSTVES